jgi:hypothetical protein
MGIAALAATGHPQVLERFPDLIVDMWTDVLCEIKETLRLQDEDRSVVTVNHS